jgi:hypothetical protein
MNYLEESARTLQEAADKLDAAVSTLTSFQGFIERVHGETIRVDGKSDMVIASYNARTLAAKMADECKLGTVSWDSDCILCRY